jgi:hypothetical protein
MRMVLRDFLPAHHVDAIVIAALWEEEDIGDLRGLIAYLKPYAGTIDLIGPMPRYDEAFATLLAQSLWRGNLAGIASHLFPSVPLVDRHMAAAFSSDVNYVSPNEVMCPRGDCLLFAAPGIPMEFDYHHLTTEGSRRLVGIFRDKKMLDF